jgi:hypothetical protein
MTEASKQALAILRDTSNFQWHVIPIFVIVLYIYGLEAEKKNWSAILAGLAFWGMDWFNEVWNGLIFHFTQYSAAWTAPKGTAFLIFIGLNIEICLMFSILGLFCVKLLPKDKDSKILGIPNRAFMAVFTACLCVVIEIILNAAGALVWEYSWWNIPNVFLIFLFGYLPFMVVSFWVYDMEKVSSKIKAVGCIFTVDIAAILVFGAWLRWI